MNQLKNIRKKREKQYDQLSFFNYHYDTSVGVCI
jgi:hypothetical protein